MTETADLTDCPSFEEISAYVDGECGHGVREHVESCADCQGVVRSLRLVSAAVGKACEPPAGLAGRVLAACRESDSEVAAPTLFWGRSLLRYAAALVLTAGLAMAVRTAVVRSGDGAPGGEGQSVASVPAPTVPGGAVPRPGVSPVGHGGVVPVSANTQFGTPRMAPATGQRVLAETVEHLWVVPSVGQAESWMQAQVPGDAWSVASREKDAVTASVTISDAGLQKLVQGMYDKGWSLVSDELPQPNDARRVRFDGRTVAYRASFVSAGSR